jgi:hypothetical protein
MRNPASSGSARKQLRNAVLPEVPGHSGERQTHPASLKIKASDDTIG